MQKTLLGAVAVVAIAGWIAVFYVMKGSSDLKEQFTASKAKLSEATETLTNTQNRLRLQQDAAGTLEEIGERMGSVQAEAAALTRQIRTGTSELQTLRQKTAAGETGLASLTREIEAKKSALASLAQDIEAARADLDRLRSERHEAVSQTPAAGSAVGSTPPATVTSKAVSQSPAAGSAVGSIPQAPAAPKAVSEPSSPEKVTKTQEGDRLADARRRFRRIDQDGDGRFDRLDFRLKRVSVFGLIDANDDDYLTPDETLLSPEAFQEFDTDGDGKISSLELADRRGFSVMDIDRDEYITFEEYVKFLRIGPE